ncbi:MAG: tRNA (adenosine(37)-N6)-threonylcarbamoyltransferase complex transferase subunit TsaD [Candidatus Hydrogenedentota bacterium]
MTTILGIESSCDDTGIGIVRDGCNVLVNDVSSQVDVHATFGGVVPEIASRMHVEVITQMVETALDKLSDPIDAVAYTNGPGLMGSLLVGTNFAKAFAYARGIPSIPVHHIEGHIFSAFLQGSPPEFPCLVLIVSGGHTQLIHGHAAHEYTLLGSTRDDAVGESFDKVARMLGLPYPGGPSIQNTAKDGDPDAIKFPRAFAKTDNLEFSYSGLKTAVLYETQRNPDRPIADIAASFQAAAIDILLIKTKQALTQTKAPKLILAGGVAANKLLRERLTSELDVPVCMPAFSVCMDNGAMIAAAGHSRFMRGEYGDLTTIPIPSISL